MSVQPGTVVRLKHDPARVGTVTSHTRTIAGHVNWYVQFPTGFQWVPEDQLEPAETPRDPLDLLLAGTLSPASDLRRVLTHARLSGRLQDLIYSLFTTQTDFYPHQFKPVLRLLTGVTNGILIADEVGLGKTIEAGLIWTELRTRFEYQRLFVVCPAVLCKKWQMELRVRFGVKADIVSAAEAFERLRDSNASVNGDGFALIGSMQGLRPPKDWRNTDAPSSGREKLATLLADRVGEPPLIDFLVVDEAHHMRNRETATNELGQLLRAVSAHVALLSATPVNLASDDLFSLMQILDRDTFSNAWEFGDILRANGPLVAARDRVLGGLVDAAGFVGLLSKARSHPVLEGSQTLAGLIESPPTNEQLAHPRTRAEIAHQLDQANLLGHVINRTRKRHVQEHRIVRNAVAQAVELSPVEAEFYRLVTEGVREFCKEHGTTVGFMLTMPQRLMASCMPAAFRYWKEGLAAKGIVLDRGLEDVDDSDSTESEEFDRPEQLGSLVRALVERVQTLGDYSTLRASDSKYDRLLGALREYFHEYPGAKVVLFTSFRATLAYLNERLRQDHVGTMLMHGDTADKTSVMDAFRDHDGAMVLLSSEVGSEGVDLQFARLVVNYDLPWNPMRVEQRIGRLDRLGQKAKSIAIWNLFCAGTIDQRIYERLYERIGIFQHALGGLEPILGAPVERLTRELLTDTLSPQQERERIDAAFVAIENNRREMEELEDEAAQFFALGDYLLDRVRDAQRLGRHVQSEDLRNYVVEFLRAHHPDTEMRADSADPFAMELRLKPAAKVDLDAFLRKHRLSGATRLTQNSGGPVRCRFQNTVIETDAAGGEIISQFHPLVRYAREKLMETESDLRLAIAVRVALPAGEGSLRSGRYVFVIERWSVSGVQEVERLAYEAVELGSDRVVDEEEAESLVSHATSAGENWLSAAHDVPPEAAEAAARQCLQRLEERYGAFERTIRLQNADRANALLATLQRHVDGSVGRIEGEIAALRTRGHLGLVAANEGRIRKLRERSEMRRIEIEKRNDVQTNRALFLVGVAEALAPVKVVPS